MKLCRFFYPFSFLLLVFSAELIALPQKPTSLGEIAEHLTFGTHIVTQLVHLVCFIVGASLLMMGILFFKANRENPKFMPLDKVILYLFCGVILISLPFYNKIFGTKTGSTIDQQKHSSAIRSTDLDAPLDFGNDYNH